MKWKNSSKVVYNETDLKEAIRMKYVEIEIRGGIVEKIHKKYDNDPKWKTASGIAMVGGLFLWPLFFAGLLGSALTMDFSKYEMTQISEEKIVIKLKEKFKK